MIETIHKEIGEGITFSHLVKSKKISQLIWQLHILFQRCFGRVSSVYLQALMMKKLNYKCYNQRITTRYNGNVQSHDQEESKLNSTINANSDSHTLKGTLIQI